MSLCASHRLPTVVRHLLERRAVAIALRHLRRLRARSGADFVEQLTDKTERVNLIVVLAGGETQQLGPQVRKPWRALPHIERAKGSMARSILARLRRRLLAGYSNIEVGLLHCVQMARGGDIDMVLKRMFRFQGETRRINEAGNARAFGVQTSQARSRFSKSSPSRQILSEDTEPICPLGLVGRQQRQARVR
jgi:hypothetical protein